MESYLEILTRKASEYGLPLLSAFKSADIPTSTYYRSVNGDTELRIETARKVMVAIEKLHTLQQIRSHPKELRGSNKRIDIRKARKRIKPRSLG